MRNNAYYYKKFHKLNGSFVKLGKEECKRSNITYIKTFRRYSQVRQNCNKRYKKRKR